jgi:hypothetical protein
MLLRTLRSACSDFSVSLAPASTMHVLVTLQITGISRFRAAMILRSGSRPLEPFRRNVSMELNSLTAEMPADRSHSSIAVGCFQSSTLPDTTQGCEKWNRST